jgi:glucose/mannose-6-phosphate isomerase
MKTLIEGFPNQIREAIEIASAAQLKHTPSGIENIVICGMGGSGIGGRIVSQWVSNELSVPLVLLQDYVLPAFVGKNSLVIGSSYSGNTEETLIALKEAQRKGALIAGICSGGELKLFCEQHDYDCIVVRGGFPPRAATAYSVVQLIKILEVYGLIQSGKIKELLTCASLLESYSSEIHTASKEIAHAMFGKIGVIYSGVEYESVVIRTRQQFNENSKFLCISHVIPEMNHNELVGWGGGDERFSVLFIDGEDISLRNKKRLEISREIVSSKTPFIKSVVAKGESYMQRTIYLIHLVDWASYYLCELNKADIMDIKVIDRLKSELSKL